MERFDAETVPPQDADPVAVARMELDAAAGPLHATRRSLRSLQTLFCEPFGLRYTKGDQDAVGQEHHPSVGREQPRRYPDPELRIAPQACAVLTDNQIERRRGKRYVLRVR